MIKNSVRKKVLSIAVASVMTAAIIPAVNISAVTPDLTSDLYLQQYAAELITTILDAGNITTGTYSSEINVNDIFSVTASTDKPVTINQTTTTTSDGLHTISRFISLGGGGSTSYRSIKINASSASTLTVYMMSSSSTASRTVNLLDGTGTIVSTATDVNGTSLDAYSFVIDSPGEYYLTSVSSGLNVYYAELTENEQYTEPIYISGDIDCNGKINSIDYALIKKGLITDVWQSTAIKATADVDGNHKVDTDDCILMKKYILGQNVSFVNYTGIIDSPQIPDISEGVVYASSTGTSNGNGTAESPYDLVSAISKVEAGGTIYCNAGTYNFSSVIKISESNSGTADKLKTITSYNGDVIFDFSGMSVGSSNRGVSMEASYWHWYGITLQNAGDNGMILGGNNNIIEMCKFQKNQDSGLQVSRINSNWPSNNLILNCTSCNNCDDATMENADGFAAKLTCGEGNVFDGCISYNNSDDGWDLFAKTDTGAIGVVTIRNCVAFRNGYTEDGRGYGECDGNGFKLGGSGVGTAHIVKNCISFENLHGGFTDNNNPLLAGLSNCTAYNNALNSGSNFNMYRATTSASYSNLLSYKGKNNATNDKLVGTIENSVFMYSSSYYKITDKQSISNNAVGSKTADVSDSDFVSVTAPAMNTVDFHTYWRNSDGSLNLKGFLEVDKTSSYYGLGATLGIQ